MQHVTDDRCPTPMALLRSGVPLSLLLDLAFGPDSVHVLVSEQSGRPVFGRAPLGATPRAPASRTPPAELW